MKTKNKKRNRSNIISFLIILSITLTSFLPCFTSVASTISTIEATPTTTTLIPLATVTTTTTPSPIHTILPNQIQCLDMTANGSSFDGSYTITVSLTNRSKLDWDVTDWKFYLSKEYNIIGTENAEYALNTYYYIITPDSSIRTILPGDTVSFSFTAKGTMPSTLSCHEVEYSGCYRNGPLSASINAPVTTPPSPTPIVTPSPTPTITPSPIPSSTPALELTTNSNSWDNGYCITIFVKNISDLPIDDWVIIVNSDFFNVSNIWSAKYTDSDNFYYIIPDTWAQTITAGNSANFGFNATGSMPSQFNYTLKYYINGTEYKVNDTLILKP